MSSGVVNLLKAVVSEVERVFMGKRAVVEQAIIALLARGHILLEDVPGAGKTLLAKALARAIGGEFRRIQFTADLLPSDITGVNVWSAKEERFVFHAGPVFANVVLADEINRASPRTQSALLEAMSERQVTTDKATRALPEPFIVIATQNPHEHHGTYPLPESQLDRFLMRLTVGYPERDVERRIVEMRGLADKVEKLVQPVATADDVVMAQRLADEVAVPAPVMEYAMDLVAASRSSEFLEIGISTRGAVNLVAAARARAAMYGRDFCIFDDIKTVFVPCAAHRVIVKGHGPSARDQTIGVLTDIVARTPVPGD